MTKSFLLFSQNSYLSLHAHYTNICHVLITKYCWTQSGTCEWDLLSAFFVRVMALSELSLSRCVCLCVCWIGLLVCGVVRASWRLRVGAGRCRELRKDLFLTPLWFHCPYARGSCGPAAWGPGWPIQWACILWGQCKVWLGLCEQ